MGFVLRPLPLLLVPVVVHHQPCSRILFTSATIFHRRGSDVEGCLMWILEFCVEDAVTAARRVQEPVVADVSVADVARDVWLPVEREGRLALDQAAGRLRAVLTLLRSLLFCWSPLWRVRPRRPRVVAHEALAERSKRIIVVFEVHRLHFQILRRDTCNLNFHEMSRRRPKSTMINGQKVRA